MASIADVYVTVLPETGKIADGIKRAFREVDAEAYRAGQRWGKEIDRCLTIAGGTEQILLTLAGERLLGLPR
jgi:hypothetical protein